MSLGGLLFGIAALYSYSSVGMCDSDLKEGVFFLFSKRLFHRGMMGLFNKQCKEHLVYTEENNKLIINNSVYTSYSLFFNSFSDLISF